MMFDECYKYYIHKSSHEIFKLNYIFNNNLNTNSSIQSNMNQKFTFGFHTFIKKKKKTIILKNHISYIIVVIIKSMMNF
jgi:hypothetical protein